MADLNALLVPATGTTYFNALLGLLATARFPVTTWRVGDPSRTILRAIADTLADASAVVQQIAAGVYLQTASGGWLDLVAGSQYGLTRNKATAARGFVLLTVVPGAGPYTFAPGQLVVSDGTYHYANVTEATVTSDEPYSALVEAQEVGSGPNLSQTLGTITQVTAGLVAGLSVSNPGLGGEVGTWLVQPGTDEETDEALRDRCRASWSTIGVCPTALSVQFWATSAGATSVTKAKVVGYPAAGIVDIRLSGPDGVSVSDSDLALVKNVLNSKRPLCCAYNIQTTSNFALPLSATITVSPTYFTSAVTAAKAALKAYIRTVPIGGTVRVAKIIGALDVPGVTQIVLTSSVTGLALTAADDFVLGPNQSPTIADTSLTFVAQ